VLHLAHYVRAVELDALKPGEFGVVLGADLARNLRALRGDKIALIAPQGERPLPGVGRPAAGKRARAAEQGRVAVPLLQIEEEIHVVSPGPSMQGVRAGVS
jgi:hypothetical protein